MTSARGGGGSWRPIIGGRGLKPKVWDHFGRVADRRGERSGLLMSDTDVIFGRPLIILIILTILIKLNKNNEFKKGWIKLCYWPAFFHQNFWFLTLTTWLWNLSFCKLVNNFCNRWIDKFGPRDYPPHLLARYWWNRSGESAGDAADDWPRPGRLGSRSVRFWRWSPWKSPKIPVKHESHWTMKVRWKNGTIFPIILPLTLLVITNFH